MVIFCFKSKSGSRGSSHGVVLLLRYRSERGPSLFELFSSIIAAALLLIDFIDLRLPMGAPKEALFLDSLAVGAEGLSAAVFCCYCLNDVMCLEPRCTLD